MNREEAWLRLHRVLRPHEQVLGFCDAVALPYEDAEMRLISGPDKAPVWVAVTPARCIEIGANGNLRSTPWGDIGSLEITQRRKRWQYSIHPKTSSIPYSPIQVDDAFASLLRTLQAGGIPLASLSDELTSYSSNDHDDYLRCNACGEIAGKESLYTSSCRGCHRMFTPDVDATHPSK